MTFTRRRLPHFDVVGARLFVTFRLHGSLPSNRVFPPANMTTGRAFLTVDRILDAGSHGPLYLRKPEIAKMVIKALHTGEQRFQRYRLFSWVIMPNHVHLLLESHVPQGEWLRSLKGFTGHEANRILGMSGRPFWQAESFDRQVRNDQEFGRIKHYIEWNPVKASLAAFPEEYPWSSAAPGGSPAAGPKA
jgi:REP element-mobilizing transposase RayT